MATKNNKPASAYAKPHTMSGGKVALGNGTTAEPTAANKVDMTVGNINRDGYDPKAKTSGIKVRGTGAATKGLMARGPMA
jgi:hypothetical protein